MWLWVYREEGHFRKTRAFNEKGKGHPHGGKNMYTYGINNSISNIPCQLPSYLTEGDDLNNILEKSIVFTNEIGGSGIFVEIYFSWGFDFN